MTLQNSYIICFITSFLLTGCVSKLPEKSAPCQRSPILTGYMDETQNCGIERPVNTNIQVIFDDIMKGH